VGVANEYFDIYNLALQKGTFFNDYQRRMAFPVCVIGANIDSKFFPKENAVGKYIKFDKIWLRVIGVLEKNEINLTAFEQTGVNVFNDIFIYQPKPC